jgi:hypothetical protein
MMPDLSRSIRHLLHASIKLHHGITIGGGALPFRFAHLSEHLSITLESHSGRFRLMNRVGI